MGITSAKTIKGGSALLSNTRRRVREERLRNVSCVSWRSSYAMMRRPSWTRRVLAISSTSSASSWEEEEEKWYHEELEKLLEIVPADIRTVLRTHKDVRQLIELVMDLGRPPIARFPEGDQMIIDDRSISYGDLQFATENLGEFGDDNRAAIRNRAGRIVGLTLRVGRAISGSIAIAKDLVESGDSLLLLGPPGVGKTTAIRGIARYLADDLRKRVVIVDTSNEIGGDGDIPHYAVGRARRMQVPCTEAQHEVMIEAVENHMPEVIIIDEIGTEKEAIAARTIAQRGIQLIATAHGTVLQNLLKNPALQDLVGGIASVTLGDDEARRRHIQKSILERKGPPTFSIGVEMENSLRWKVHRSIALAVDDLLQGRQAPVELREIVDGNLVKLNISSVEMDATSTSNDFQKSLPYVYDDPEGLNQDSQEGETKAIRIFPYEIDSETVNQVIDTLKVAEEVRTVDDIRIADCVLGLRSRVKNKKSLRDIAKSEGIPILALKACTQAQIVRAIRHILGEDNFVPVSIPVDDNPKKVSDEAILEESLNEAIQATESIVLPKKQPVQLYIRDCAVVEEQRSLIESKYSLLTEVVHIDDMSAALRVFPEKIKLLSSST